MGQDQHTILLRENEREREREGGGRERDRKGGRERERWEGERGREEERERESRREGKREEERVEEKRGRGRERKGKRGKERGMKIRKGLKESRRIKDNGVKTNQSTKHDAAFYLSLERQMKTSIVLIVVLKRFINPPPQPWMALVGHSSSLPTTSHRSLSKTTLRLVTNCLTSS